MPLLKAAKRVVLLSGTPALSRPKELHQQLMALLPRAGVTMAAYGERYCSGGGARMPFGRYNGARAERGNGIKLALVPQG